ncbi:uncharacterized protein CYPRO_1561 [Cyclonatronum proteinivorum]|uniref:DUF418 domain-containing protein n=1 Tax=Cyclonatronum proteinivorum TaxID=1457365 RepID=A0A345UK10_9BACT|nr:DUF418 domain-containing protein [Cyclonatronum proteinivorum]AXJ00812.1 uncharacterized protein CYPRO_1561 [Cyclonatronum proteinivorum]
MSPISSQTAETAAPVKPVARIADLDILRGIALFGILVVNLALFSHPMFQYAAEGLIPGGPLQDAAAFFIRLFFEGKFITLFSFLFGLGFYIFTERLREKGLSPGIVFSRRMGILLLIGLAHGHFLWSGDILLPYAVIGLLLLLFMKRTDKTLKIWIGIALGLLVFINAALVALVAWGMSMPEAAAEIEAAFAQQRAEFQEQMDRGYIVYLEGSFREMMAYRQEELHFAWFGMLFSPAGYAWIFSVFIFGLLVARKGQGLLQNPKQLREWFIPTRQRNLIAGLIFSGLYAWSGLQADAVGMNSWVLIQLISFLIGTPALTMAYVGYILRLLEKHESGESAFGRQLHLAAPVGRMALTNYILQSVICTTIFLGYGLGFYGSLSPLGTIPLALAIFAVQIVYSNYYFKTRKMGPLEWLWRKGTYLK